MNHLVAVENDAPVVRAALDTQRLARDDDVRAEPRHLPECAVGKLFAGYAVGKSEIVFDPRRHAGLAAGRFALYENRAQPFGGSVHGRCQARRPGADDGHFVAVPLRARSQPEGLASSRVVGELKRRPSAKVTSTVILFAFFPIERHVQAR